MKWAGAPWGKTTGLAAESTDLGAADVEHIGPLCEVGQGDVRAIRRQTVAQPCAIHEEGHLVLLTDRMESFQFGLGVEGAVLGGVGEIHHAGEDHVVMVAVGVEGGAEIPDRGGVQLAVLWGSPITLWPVNSMAPASWPLTWPVAAATTPSHRCSIDAMTMALVWVPPEINVTSASGHRHAAQIFSFALAQ